MPLVGKWMKKIIIRGLQLNSPPMQNSFNATFLADFAKPLVCINKRLSETPIEEINSMFVSKKVSYLPVLKSGGRELDVVLSRKKYFELLLKQKNTHKLEDIFCTDSIQIIELTDSLDSVMHKLNNCSGLILREDGFLTKFISPKVAVSAFNDYASNFILIESLELKLRELIKKHNPYFIDVLIKHGQSKFRENKLKTENDLVFSDYSIIFRENWEYFEPLNYFSKEVFLKNLQQINEMRNGLFHFRNDSYFDREAVKEILNTLG